MLSPVSLTPAIKCSILSTVNRIRSTSIAGRYGFPKTNQLIAGLVGGTVTGYSGHPENVQYSTNNRTAIRTAVIEQNLSLFLEADE
jgi:hypothetical protein